MALALSASIKLPYEILDKHGPKIQGIVGPECYSWLYNYGPPALLIPVLCAVPPAILLSLLSSKEQIDNSVKERFEKKS